jgi:hypothetical protein
MAAGRLARVAIVTGGKKAFISRSDHLPAQVRRHANGNFRMIGKDETLLPSQLLDV